MRTLQFKKLSIIIPAYNEENTIRNIMDKVRGVKLVSDISKEIIVVNDCSTDGTEQIILEYIKSHPDDIIQYFKHKKNVTVHEKKHKKTCIPTFHFILLHNGICNQIPGKTSHF